MHGLVTYLFDIPLFPRGPWLLAFGLLWFLCVGYLCVICFWFCVSPFVFFFMRTSRVAPTARTLRGVTGHTTFIFGAVVALLFLDFHVCPTVFDLAKQRRKIVWGVSEVGKTDFLFYFSCCASLSWFSIFLCCDGARPTVSNKLRCMHP